VSRLDRFKQRFFDGVPRYRWLDTLGHGGMGIVFKVLDVELDEVVAIKVLVTDVATDEHDLLARFKREINLNRKIKHPNVARIHDFGSSGEFPFITMEYIPGRDLKTLVRERGRLSPPEAVSILRQVALGSHAAHRLGIVHRDLKSANVMIDDEGAVAILDFGLARAKTSARITLDSAMVGTPNYMSPEQAMGKPADARSDIYAIGVIGFELLTGRLPFSGSTPMEVILKVIGEDPPDLLAGMPGIDGELRTAVRRAMARDPDDRFVSAADLETELAMLRLPPVLELDRGPGESDVLRSVADKLSVELESAFDALLTDDAPSAMPLVPPEPSPEASAGRGAAPPTVEAAHEKREGAPKTLESPRRPVVLVVDDEAKERKFASDALAQSGCDVYEAASGQEALEVLLKFPIQVILMDVGLPGMDGFDVTRVVKAQPKLAELPILLTTPKLERSQFAFALQTGAADFVAKPIAPSALAWRVWKILRHRGFIHPAEREAQKEATRATIVERLGGRR
jgi:serine/threonine protein kinase